MNKENAEQRLKSQMQRQKDRQLGAELRTQALGRLVAQHSDLPQEKFESWIQLLETEETEPVPGISAGAAALAMMDVRDDYRRKSNIHLPTEE